MGPRVLDNETILVPDGDGLVREHTQVITSEFLDSLKSERLAKAHLRAGEMQRVCSVPTFVVDLWRRQGMDYFTMTAHEVVRQLQRDGLDAFITTTKAV